MTTPLPKGQLIELIQATFADVHRGEGISLHEATAIDDYASQSERQAARLKDTGTHWSQVPDGHIARHDTVFSFLDVKGHVYCAPVFTMCVHRPVPALHCRSDGRRHLLFDRA